jgi:hypothetical protein
MTTAGLLVKNRLIRKGIAAILKPLFEVLHLLFQVAGAASHFQASSFG